MSPGKQNIHSAQTQDLKQGGGKRRKARVFFFFLGHTHTSVFNFSCHATAHFSVAFSWWCQLRTKVHTQRTQGPSYALWNQRSCGDHLTLTVWLMDPLSCHCVWDWWRSTCTELPRVNFFYFSHRSRDEERISKPGAMSTPVKSSDDGVLSQASDQASDKQLPPLPGTETGRHPPSLKDQCGSSHVTPLLPIASNTVKHHVELWLLHLTT